MGYSDRCAIAICDRCNFKKKYTELRADGNSPGLRVCDSCWDPKNPWRLPAIQPDNILLKYPRPDTLLVAGDISYPDLTNPANPVPPNEGDYPT